VELDIDVIESEIGPLALVARGAVLCAVEFEDCRERMLSSLELRYRGATLHERRDPCGFSGRLEAYFGGEIDALEEIPVEPAGTPFQRLVWSALRKIAPGTTSSYGQLAATIGRPGAARAVGLANGSNPIGLVIPCHRVIGADGSLTGYAGGLHRKRWLLAHEGVAIDDDRFRPPQDPTRSASQPMLPFGG
jgi:methylated-DNA-[protein]-cysteine S-methyltransferase